MGKLYTDLELRKLKPLEKPRDYPVDKGLYLRVQPNGSKAWVLRLWDASGKEHRAGLGVYPKVTKKDAVEAAEEKRTLFKQTKLTPAAKKRAEREAEAAKQRLISNTFESVARRWHEQLPTTMNEKHRAQCITTLERFAFPRIGAKPIDDVTAGSILDDVIAPMLDRVDEEGNPDPVVETSMRTLQRIDSDFQYAGLRGLCKSNPAALCKKAFLRRKKEALKVKPKTNFEALTDPDDIAQLLRDLDGIPSDVTRLALQLLAYTAVRSGELRNALWTEFELEGDTPQWTIPAARMKAKRPHIVPLSRQALVCLSELKKLNPDGEFLVPGRPGSGKPISDMTLSIALRRLGYEGRQTPHGFRAIFSTLARERSSYRADAIEAQLAHVIKNRTEAAYNRAAFMQERRDLLQWYADELDGLKNPQAAKVVPIKGRAAK